MGDVIKIASDDPSERAGLYCKCSMCGHVGICTPEFDYYGNPGDSLVCQNCFEKRLTDLGIPLIKEIQPIMIDGKSVKKLKARAKKQKTSNPETSGHRFASVSRAKARAKKQKTSKPQTKRGAAPGPIFREIHAVMGEISVATDKLFVLLPKFERLSKRARHELFMDMLDDVVMFEAMIDQFEDLTTSPAKDKKERLSPKSSEEAVGLLALGLIAFMLGRIGNVDLGPGSGPYPDPKWPDGIDPDKALGLTKGGQG